MLHRKSNTGCQFILLLISNHVLISIFFQFYPNNTLNRYFVQNVFDGMNLEPIVYDGFIAALHHCEEPQACDVRKRNHISINIEMNRSILYCRPIRLKVVLLDIASKMWLKILLRAFLLNCFKDISFYYKALIHWIVSLSRLGFSPFLI